MRPSVAGERLLPPDLIIQDELHLISGPLGTMVGLYETPSMSCAPCEIERQDDSPEDRRLDGHGAAGRKPDSSAVQSPHGRHFPAAGPDRRDSFFAETHSPDESNARLYLGIAAQGRSPKVVMLRVYLALLAAAQKWYAKLGKKPDPTNPADPYMTLLGYFNSLRELGGARRLIEDEVRNRLAGYASRKRVGEADGLFEIAQIDYEPVELTSRVSTAQGVRGEARLSLAFSEKDHVDVAIATNMISVGLDITRLGLMVVFGQPKTSCRIHPGHQPRRSRPRAAGPGRHDPEHPQAARPLALRAICGVPRVVLPQRRGDQRHAVFAAGLDRGLAGTLVALAGKAHLPMTPPRGASEILRERDRSWTSSLMRWPTRARECCGLDPASAEAQQIRQRVRDRAIDLLDDWSKIGERPEPVGRALQYQMEVGSAQRLLYEFLNPELKNLPPQHPKMKFRANRSMRDVEPSVNLWLKTLDGIEIEEEDA